MNITDFSMVRQATVIDCKCDVCGLLSGKPYPEDWFNFSHQHGEWGNDSGDSIEYFDVCSIECFTNQLKNSLDEMSDYKRSATIADMKYSFAEKLHNKLNHLQTIKP